MIKYILFFGSIMSGSVNALSGSLSSHVKRDIQVRDGRTVQEWTAMGDSYASGVGAGPQPPDDTNRCFRFPQAYPPIMQSGDGSIQPNPEKFNNVACSGNTFQQILQKELLDAPEDDGKYGTRPAWGDKPEFVTITMGGNDIGILNLISTCVYSFKLWGKDCEQVIQEGHDIIQSDPFKTDLNSVIQNTLNKGRSTTIGTAFRLFITGYAQFFNQDTTQCNTVSFKPSWNPLTAQLLTVERRTSMNGLALALNRALQDAVNSFDPEWNVHYIDYDAQFQGHRFCDREEPSPNDPDTWFFNWYTKDDPTTSALFQQLAQYKASVSDSSSSTASPTYLTSDADFINALGDAAGNDTSTQSFLSDSVRVFHPSSLGHQKIRDVVEQALSDAGVPTLTSEPSSSPSCAPGATPSDVQAINLQLDSRGGTQCCGGGVIGCSLIASSGTALTALCTSNQTELCVDCARLANYVAGIISSCHVDGTVGGTQDIIEEPGLYVQISLDDTT